MGQETLIIINDARTKYLGTSGSTFSRCVRLPSRKLVEAKMDSQPGIHKGPTTNKQEPASTQLYIVQTQFYCECGKAFSPPGSTLVVARTQQTNS